MSNFDNIGKFEKGHENFLITDGMVEQKVDELTNSLLQIPKFKELMDTNIQVACEQSTMFPSVCMNKVSFSKPNENLVNLKKDIKTQLLTELGTFASGAHFNRNKMFNYYTNQYDYFYEKDLNIITNNVWRYMTTQYYDDMYVKFNKLASNPWNHEHTKTKQQQFKNESELNQTDKLTFTQVYNPIPDCFI